MTITRRDALRYGIGGLAYGGMLGYAGLGAFNPAYGAVILSIP